MWDALINKLATTLDAVLEKRVAQLDAILEQRIEQVRRTINGAKVNASVTIDAPEVKPATPVS